MESSLKVLGFIFLISSAVLEVNGADTKYCWRQKCRDGPEKCRDEKGTETKCELRDLVSSTWLDQEDHSLPGPGQVDVDYACLKMTARDPTIIGDSTDLIRGCTLRQTAEKLCDALVGIERARGKSETTCTVCYNDYCNGAFNLKTSIALMVLAVVISFRSFL